MNKGKRKMPFLFLLLVSVISVFCCAQSKAAAGTVTSYEKITWGISTGRYGVNGIHAFCAEYSKSWPLVNTTIEKIEECNNEVLRKVLYYGCNGPKNTLGNDAKAHVLTAIAVSDANIGERATGASAKYDSFYWDVVNYPSKYPTPPSNFKAYLAITASDDMQNLAFYIQEADGYVKGVKKSADKLVTEENNCYSLEGATYGLYSHEKLSESSRVGTLVMNANGQSNTVALAPGTYYACELKAPKGYAKSTEVVPFVVKTEQTIVLEFQDVPQVYDANLLIQKVDAETGLSQAQGEASLKGAEFTVKYYKGLWEQDIDPATKGVSPTRTWVFQTDEKGRVLYEDTYKVSGDELYEGLPLGTITFLETKASEGYLVNDTVFVRQITAEGDAQYVSTYSVPEVEEECVTVDLIKYHAGTTIPIKGTVFEHTSPKGRKTKLTTDENGKILVKGLEYGTHIFQEISAASGYVLNNTVHEVVVDESTDKDIHIVVYNDPILPKTGSCGGALIFTAGLTLCTISIFTLKKRRRKLL